MPSSPEKLYIENTLLRVSGALFCHDPKQAAMRRSEIELNRGIAEKHIVIRPDPKLGQPGQLAHKIFIALIKKTFGLRASDPKRDFVHSTRNWKTYRPCGMGRSGR